MNSVLSRLRSCFGTDGYRRSPSLILINGLAEQAESWYRNLPAWQRRFDVHTPTLVAYDGAALHRRIEEGLPIDVDYLVEKLRRYLDEFVTSPRCHLLANSMGGKVAVEFATRYPEKVDRLVLLCPSGLASDERLPIVEGVRRNDPQTVIESVFHRRGFADSRLIAYYQQKFSSRRWQKGLLKTIRGTLEHRVGHRLAEIPHRTLLVVGQEDQIVDPNEALAAGRTLPNGQLVLLPHCGHAPQIEEAAKVNRLVIDFLTAA